MAELINSYSPEHGRRRDLPPRWQVVRTYRSAERPVEVDVEELFEVNHLDEDGPDWNTLIDMGVTLDKPTHPGLTIEASETL